MAGPGEETTSKNSQPIPLHRDDVVPEIREQPGLPNVDYICRKYVDPVYRFIYRHVGNQQDAEDLTSRVFVAASQSLETTIPEKSISGWLFAAARTTIAEHWERHYEMRPVIDIDRLQPTELAPATDSEDQVEPKSAVSRVLEDLPERYRQVLELRFLKGYAVTETAAELAITVENVKTIQRQALATAVRLADGMA